VIILVTLNKHEQMKCLVKAESAT